MVHCLCEETSLILKYNSFYFAKFKKINKKLMFTGELVSCECCSIRSHRASLQHGHLHFCLYGRLHGFSRFSEAIMSCYLPLRVQFSSKETSIYSRTCRSPTHFLQGFLSSALTQCFGLFCPSIQRICCCCPCPVELGSLSNVTENVSEGRGARIVQSVLLLFLF